MEDGVEVEIGREGKRGGDEEDEEEAKNSGEEHEDGRMGMLWDAVQKRGRPSPMLRYRIRRLQLFATKFRGDAPAITWNGQGVKGYIMHLSKAGLAKSLRGGIT